MSTRPAGLALSLVVLAPGAAWARPEPATVELPGRILAQLDAGGLPAFAGSVGLAVGWRWLIADHLVVRASVGYTQAVASSSSVEIPSDPGAEEQANAAVDPMLDDIYCTYFKLPVLGLGAGYRF